MAISKQVIKFTLCELNKKLLKNLNSLISYQTSVYKNHFSLPWKNRGSNPFLFYFSFDGDRVVGRTWHPSGGIPYKSDRGDLRTIFKSLKIMLHHNLFCNITRSHQWHLAPFLMCVVSKFSSCNWIKLIVTGTVNASSKKAIQDFARLVSVSYHRGRTISWSKWIWIRGTGLAFLIRTASSCITLEASMTR